MKIYWTNHALIQLTEIYQYIHKDSQLYAKKVVDTLTSSTKILETYTQLGRIVPELKDRSIREIISGNYRIIYKVKTKRIDILTIIHSAQNFSDQYLPNTE